MEKKTMMYSQQMIDFEKPASAEQQHVAQATSEPPPADQGRKVLPLVRPDRQLTYGGLSHYEWPDAKPLHDRDTITVDRIRDDIDGPSHRFIIKRGDTVEAYFNKDCIKVGEVVGISHANNEVRVRFAEGTDGIWFYKGCIYPVAPQEPLATAKGQRLSEVIAEANSRNGEGLTECGLWASNARRSTPVSISVPISHGHDRYRFANTFLGTSYRYLIRRPANVPVPLQ